MGVWPASFSILLPNLELVPVLASHDHVDGCSVLSWQEGVYLMNCFIMFALPLDLVLE